MMKYGYEKHDWPYTLWVDWLMEQREGTPAWNAALEHLWEQAKLMQEGHSKGQFLTDWGNVYWEEEEAVFLHLMTMRHWWRDELKRLTAWLAREMNLNDFEALAITQYCNYQDARIPEVANYPDKPTYAHEVIIKGRKSGTNLVPEKETQAS